MPYSWDDLRRIESEQGDSFFLFDRARFRANFKEFLDEFRRIYPNSSIAYSYKTNYLPAICREVDALGGYAEVVSRLEHDLALRIGVDPRRIIFNGPLKSEDDILSALLAGSIVNLDSAVELAHVERVAREHPGRPLRVGLRCNIPLPGADVSRFGFDAESGDLAAAVHRLKALDGCALAGLHCHIATGHRSPASYRYRTERLLEHVGQHFPKAPPAFINVGGGFFGKMDPYLRQQFPAAPDGYADYADAIATAAAAAYPGGGPELILEPGAALVGDVMQFVAKVITLKEVRGHRFAVTAGSIHNIKPTLHQKQLPMRIIRRRPSAPDEVATVGSIDIVGYTCMEHDCLYRGCREPLEAEDYVLFESVGAYTVVMKPPFIRPAPAVVAHEGGSGFAVVRRPEQIDDVFRTYSFAP